MLLMLLALCLGLGGCAMPRAVVDVRDYGSYQGYPPGVGDADRLAARTARAEP